MLHIKDYFFPVSIFIKNKRISFRNKVPNLVNHGRKIDNTTTYLMKDSLINFTLGKAYWHPLSIIKDTQINPRRFTIFRRFC